MADAPFFDKMEELGERTHRLYHEAIRRLKFLETPQCRETVPEEERKKMVVDATHHFRQILIAKNLVKQVQEYDLYG
jgi:precorrin-6x reductase